ncbi:tetratricopeptide repeat protein (plasmid) [Nocardiopsis flavescens]|nr:tetratricopeptide repeat protein [Nocardiopsis flavescens]
MAPEHPPVPEDDTHREPATPPPPAPEENDERSSGGDRVDFSHGTFHGKVIGKEEHHEHHHHHHAVRVVPLALDAVPAAPGGFVGRDSELQALCARLDPAGGEGDSTAVSGAVVVSALAGMGGVGKTALALKAAQAASEADWFCAHLFVDLHGYTPHTPPLTGAAALDVLLRQMGVDPADIPPGAEERSAFYRSALQALSRRDSRERPVLVVADNAHSLDQVRPLLPGAGGHRLLVTSREALAIDGHRPLTLDTLDPGEALELLRSRLGPDDPRGCDVEGLEALASRCGCLPLALKIAAALLARKTRLAPGRLAGRLGELSRFSDAEHDLAAVFDASLAYLSPQELRVFALLGSAPGADIHTSAAAALVGLEEEDVEEVLEELAAAHLVTAPEEDRWAMHDLVAAHARTLTPPTTGTENPVGEEDSGDTAGPVDARERALDRVLDYYTAMADAADDHLQALKGDRSSGQEGVLGWLDAEIDNLLACVRTAHRTHRTYTAIYLPKFLGAYLELRRRFDDAIEAHTLACDAAQRTGDVGGEAGAWNNLGNALRNVRRFTEAIDAHTRAQQAFHQIGDTHREAMVWNNLGTALRQVRRFSETIDAHTRAQQAFHQIGDAHSEAAAWNNLGIALHDVRRFPEAIDAHTRARDLYHQVGDAHSEAGAWNNLGIALRQVGRFSEAIDAHTRAQQAFHQAGDAHSEAGAWNNLGAALQRVRRFEEAIDAHTRAQQAFHQAGDAHSEATAWNNLGIALPHVHRFTEGIDALTCARDLYHQARDPRGEAEAWSNLGIALVGVRRLAEGIDALTCARDLYHQARDPRGEATAWNNLGAVLQHVRRFEEAIDAHTRARDLHHQSGDPHSEARAWNNLGIALYEAGRPEEALEAFSRNSDYCRQTGDNHGEAQALQNLGETLLRLGQVVKAVEPLVRAVELFETTNDEHQATQTREILNRVRQTPNAEQES